MDKSTLMDSKIKPSDINFSPIPASMRETMRRSGLWVYSYYENVACKSPHTKITAKGSIFKVYCITQMLNPTGFFHTDDNPLQEVKRNNVIIGLRGQRTCYGSFDQCFTEDSIAFSGNTADILAANGLLKPGVYDLGQERILLPIINKLRESTLGALLEANNLICSLIFEIHHLAKIQNIQFSPTLSKLDKLIAELNKDWGKWWTVEEMANFCNVSENYLRRLFQKQLGVSPKQYLDNLRITHAAELLVSTPNSIKKIAQSLGYIDSYHFSRRFTQMMGISPLRYRKFRSANIAI